MAAIDLNLLVVFDAVMRERSVTVAGIRLGLSQPAMSHALARLRHMLKDSLFIRSPKGMVPTPRAERLALPIRQALEQLQQSLEPIQFEPSKATQTFRIAVDNYAAVVLVGLLSLRIRKIAPGIMAEFRPSGTLNILNLFDSGEIDLAIGSSAPPGERVSRRHLLEDTFVAVLRKDHPATKGRTLPVEVFATLPNLDITSVHYKVDFIDRALGSRKLTRHIALRAPLHSAVDVLVGSNMVSILPRRMAEALVRYRPLTIRALACSVPSIQSVVAWPRRLDNQAGHRWLRDVVTNVCRNLRDP